MLFAVVPVPKSKRKKVQGFGSCCAPQTFSAVWIVPCCYLETMKKTNELQCYSIKKVHDVYIDLLIIKKKKQIDTQLKVCAQYKGTK